MATVTPEEGKLFYKELRRQRRAVVGQALLAQVEIVEPLRSVPAGESFPPFNPLKVSEGKRTQEIIPSPFRQVIIREIP